MQLQPDEIWQDVSSGKVESDKPLETAIKLISEHSDGTFAYLGAYVDVSILDASNKEVKTIRLRKLDYTYQADLSSKDIEGLFYSKNPHLFTLVPYVGGIAAPKEAHGKLKIHTLYPRAEDIIADLKAEKDRVSAQQATKLTLSVKDKRTGALQDIPLSEIRMLLRSSQKSEDQGAVISPLERVSEGVYESTFVAEEVGQYIIDVYYLDKPVASKNIFICGNILDVHESWLEKDRSHASITDKAGVRLSFIAKNSCGVAVENLLDKIRFALKDENGKIIDHIVKSEITQSTPGVYSQYVGANFAGIYSVHVFLKQGSGEEVALNLKEFFVHFTGPHAPEKMSIKITDNILWQDPEGTVNFPNSSEIVFSSRHNDGSFAYLGTDVSFEIFNAEGEKVLSIAAKQKGKSYVANLNAVALPQLPSIPTAYSFSVRPVVPGVAIPASVKADFQVYASVFDISDLSAKLVFDKEAMFLGEFAKATLTLTHKSSGLPFPLPLSYLSSKAFGSLIKAADFSISGFWINGEGVYDAILQVNTGPGNYYVEAYYGNQLIAKNSIRVCDSSVNNKFSKVEVNIAELSITDKEGVEVRFTARSFCDTPIEEPLAWKLRFVLEENNKKADMRYLSPLKNVGPGIYSQRLGAKRPGVYVVKVYAIGDTGLESAYDLPEVKVNFAKASLPSQGSISLAEKELWWDELGNKGKPHETKVIYTPKHNDGTFAYLGEEIAFKLTNEGGSSIFVAAQKAGDHYEALVKTASLKSEDYAPRDKAYAINITPFLSGIDFPSSHGTALTLHRPMLKFNDWVDIFVVKDERLHLKQPTYISLVLKNHAEIKEFAKHIRVGFVNKASQEDNKLGHLVQQSNNANEYRADFTAGTKVGEFRIGFFFGDKLLKDASIRIVDPKLDLDKSFIGFGRVPVILDPEGFIIKFAAVDTEGFPLYGKKDDFSFRLQPDMSLEASTNYDILSPLEETLPGLYEQRIRLKEFSGYTVYLLQREGDGWKVHWNEKAAFRVADYEMTHKVMTGTEKALSIEGYNADYPYSMGLYLDPTDPKEKEILSCLIKARISYKVYSEGGKFLGKILANRQGIGYLKSAIAPEDARFYVTKPYTVKVYPTHEYIKFRPDDYLTVPLYGKQIFP